MNTKLVPEHCSLRPSRSKRHRLTRVAIAVLTLVALPSSATAETPTLDETRSMARQSAFAVESVDAELGILEAQRREAGAALRPRVQVVGQFEQRDRQVEIDLPDVPGLDVGTPVVMPGNQLRGLIDVDAPLVNLDGWERVRAARSRVDAGEAQLDAVSDAVELTAIQLHLRVVALDANIAVEEERRALAQSQVDTLSQRRDVGLATEFEVRRAESRVLEAELSLETARRTRDEALRTLSVLLGGVELDGVAPLTSPTQAPTLEQDWFTPESARARSEVEAIALGLDALDSAARAERLGLVPDLVLSGQAMATTAEAIDGENSQWYVQASVIWTPYDRGLRRSREDRATAQADQQRVLMAQQLAVVRAEVLDAQDALMSAEERLRLANELEALAGEALRLAEDAQEAGSATALDVQQAQTALLEARTSRIAAEQGREAAVWELLWATGAL